MSLSDDQLRRIARLARIEMRPEESEAVAGRLNRVLGMIGEMSAVDTTGIEPMAHAQDVALPLREDKVTEFDQHELFQEQAPAVEDSLYLVPRVIE